MAQITRADRVNAVLFLLIGLFLVVSVILTLVGWPLAKEKRTFYLRFEDSVTGIDVGTPVRYKGVKIGQINDIRVDPTDSERIQVTLAVGDDEAPIRVSTFARITAASILGPYNIELTGSRETSPLLPEGSDIPASASFLTDLLKTGKTAGDAAVSVLANLEQWTSDENRLHFERLLGRASEAMTTLEEGSQRLLPRIEKIIETWERLGTSLERTSEEAREPLLSLMRTTEETVADINRLVRDVDAAGISADTRATLTRMRDEIERTGTSLRDFLEANRFGPRVDKALAEFERLATTVERTMATFEQEGLNALRADLGPTLNSLQRASKSIRSLVDTIRRNPRGLLFGSRPDEVPLPGDGK